MKVICIQGKAGSGKDTVGKMLSDSLQKRGYRVLVTHYADLVKYICRQYFDWDGQKDERGRTLLQYVGTDIVRAQDENYWVDFICDIIRFFGSEWDYVIIPDTRFPNETDRLRESGFNTYHLRVERPGMQSALSEEQQNHPSETALDDCTPECYMENSGTLDDLRDSVEFFVKEELTNEN